MNARVEAVPHVSRPKVLDVSVLTKPGIMFMVLVVASAAYWLAAAGQVDWALLGWLLAGTALMSGGAAALNMWLEREPDGLMRRTENRPLPAGRLSPATAAGVGLSMVVAGAAVLSFMVNPLTAGLGVISAGVYLFAYTPLKKISSTNTLVGAITGAMPPAMGWAAARGSVGIEAAVLFSILFFWQMPHFLAIAWMYREDYERAGFRMLVVGDVDGMTTAHQVIVQTTALVLASVAPVVIGMAGTGYMTAALVLGAGFLAMGIRFAFARTRGRARALFFTSIVYLPALLGALLLGATYGG